MELCGVRSPVSVGWRTEGDALGTWLTTITFPDGTVRYCDYSTVVEAMVGPLYTEVCRAGEALPDGERCHRDCRIGEPLPASPRAPIAEIGELVLVEVEEQANHGTWHALYCPNRAEVIGPSGSHHRHVLQEEFDLIRDDDGVRHLCDAGRSPSVCGREVTGEPLGLYFPAPGMGGWPDPPPAPDLFAEWNAPDLCRACFFMWLTKPPPVLPPDEPPVPAPKSSWWTALRRLWQG
jgi:hypothetical protein